MSAIQKKRLAFLIPSLAVGGAELQLTEQIDLLTGRGYTVKLIVLGDKFDLLNRINLPEGSTLLLKQASQNYLCTKGIFLAFGSAFSVYRFLRRTQTKKLIAILPMAHWVGRWVVFVGRLFFFNVHLANYHKSQQFKANPLTTVPKKLFHRFNSVLAWYTDKANLFISQSVLNDVSRNQFVRRPVIIYNFVIERHIEESLAFQYLQQHDRQYQKLLVIPGRVHPVKGQFFFLKAVESLLTPTQLKEEGILIVIAGGGPDELILMEKCRQMGIEENLIITGFIENVLLLSFIKLADLVIIPSLFEGLGNVAIEALMLRKPVLASDAGGLTEVIKDSRCGITFRAGSTDELVVSLRGYLNNDFKFDTEAGYKWYMAHFTPDIHMERLHRFIQKL